MDGVVVVVAIVELVVIAIVNSIVAFVVTIRTLGSCLQYSHNELRCGAVVVMVVVIAVSYSRCSRCAFQPQEKMFLNVSFMEMMTQNPNNV